MPKPRVRQHVNPFSHRESVVVPDWSKIFADPSLPTEVDVGCGHGDFLVAWAEERGDLNVVGLEIREPMVEGVQRKIDRAGLKNAAVVHCNANVSLTELFGPRSLATVYVQFPDPWFKKRHHKRRVMTTQFVTDVASCLRLDGALRFMTDYEQYAIEVAESLAERPEFVALPIDEGRPHTHREDWHLAQGDQVYRHAWRLA